MRRDDARARAPRPRARFVAWAGRTFDLERPHVELVTEAGRLLDRLDAIPETVDADGRVVAEAEAERSSGASAAGNGGARHDGDR